MYSIVIVLALSDGAMLPGQLPYGGCGGWSCCGGPVVIVPAVPYGGCCGCYGAYYGYPGATVQLATPQPQQPGTGGKEGAVSGPIPKKWPEPIKKKVKANLEDRGLADADVDRLIEDAQALGCKGNDFNDLLNVPGLKTQKGEALKDAMDVYMRTLKSIAADPSPKKWPDNVKKTAKTNLEDRGIADADVDRLIDDAQAVGCKGNDFNDFFNVPGLKSQKGDALKTALDVYMRSLKDTRQGQNVSPAPATIYVELPADARLSFDGAPTVSRSANRVFVTPPLEPGKRYSYTLEATVTRDGKTLTSTQRVTVRAGLSTQVKLEEPSAASIASR
jgi:uncharacterized protein (TIGR03000 family)